MHTLPHAPYLMNTAQRPAQWFVRGEGAYLWDAQGQRYLDWVQGWAVNCLGHAPAPVVQALQQQAQTLINPCPAFYNAPSLALAERLIRHSVFHQVFFANSGAEANEGAIKLARKWGRLHKAGAYEIITFRHGFHGRTLAAMAASGKDGWEDLFAPNMPGFRKAVLNDLASVKALIGPQTVAVMLEPIQGEAGVIPATHAFLRELRQLCDEQGLLLIFDEVQTGCGRTGTLFAYQHSGVEPDILTLGKGIGGGVPLSALLAKAHCCCFVPGDQGGTYCGNPLMCAAGVAVLDCLLADGFLARSQVQGEALATGLRALAAEFGLGEVRGQGMLWALELGHEVALRVVEVARAHGLLLNAPRPSCLRFMPALTTCAAEITEGLALLRQSLGEVLAECHLSSTGELS